MRAALIPEEAAEFDQQWRAVMARATESLDLTEVLATLEAWRRVAWSTSAVGPDGHRRMLARAERRARTGERGTDAVSWDELSARLGLGG